MAAAAVVTSKKRITSENRSNPFLNQEDVPMSLVHAASVNGDKARLQKLLKDPNYHVDEMDQFGRTPLMLAVLADHYDCAEVLLKHGANIDAKDYYRRTALHWAAYKGIYRLCVLLISRGAYWREKDHEELTALHLATKHTNTRCLTLVLKELFIGEVDEQDINKRTALHWSASYGNVEAVKILISEGSNIGIPDVDGKTPLHWAATAGDSPTATATVQVILDAEPSVINWQDYEGRTALHLAVADGNVNIVETLINFQTHLEKCNVSVLDNIFRTPLHWAAVLGHTHIVNRLLDKKASFSSSDGNGATALHYAAQNNHAETVQAFLSHDDITDEPDLERRTALMWAAGRGADDVIKVMMQYGGDIDATDNTGATALHAAAMAGHASTIRVLLEFGANVSVTDQNKHTPLFRAAEMGQTDALISLIEGGASVQVVDDEGRSPLHWAARGGHSCVCANLLKHKISPNVQDHHGRTPLQCSAYGGFINCMNILLEEGADPDLQDQEGVTALHYASSTGYMDAVRLLLEHGAFINHMEVNEDCFTPLDHALLNGHHDVTQFMIEHGALSINTIRDLAASRIQACFRGYCVRKTFLERKLLLVKHEELRKTAAARKKEQTHPPACAREKEAELHSGIQIFPKAADSHTVEIDPLNKDDNDMLESDIKDDNCKETKNDFGKLNELESAERGDFTKKIEKDNNLVTYNKEGTGNNDVRDESKSDERSGAEKSSLEDGGTLDCECETLLVNGAIVSGGKMYQVYEKGSLKSDSKGIHTDGIQRGDLQGNNGREDAENEVVGDGDTNENIDSSGREVDSVNVEKKVENETKKDEFQSSLETGEGGRQICLDEELKEDKENANQVEGKPAKNSRRQENVDRPKSSLRRKSGKADKSHTSVTNSKNSGIVGDRGMHYGVAKKDHSMKGVKGVNSMNKLRLDDISVERNKQGSAVQHLKRPKVDSLRKPVLNKRSSMNSKNETKVFCAKNDKNGESGFFQTVKLSKGKDKTGERSKLPEINKGAGSERLVKSARHCKTSNLGLNNANILSRERLSSWPTTSLKSEFDWRGQTSDKNKTVARSMDQSRTACDNEPENSQTSTRPKQRQRALSAIVQTNLSSQGTKTVTSTDNHQSRRQKLHPRKIRTADDNSL